ncbi:5-formyltetrahydrofolate cyclo-ligase [Pontimonas sp.]|nr:5-formyltetrahydrofolate cyclo-ligase [Pontimonas sp.]MDA8887034.1 5-formyltetrahydrofolate cyclo-ligase [Pontimonas sp.]
MAEPAHPSKAALRAEIRERRRIMTLLERELAADKLLTNMKFIVDQYVAGRVACYLAGQDEPPTRAFVEWASGEGIAVLVPAAREDGLMDWVLYETGDELIQDHLGIDVPENTVYGPIVLSKVDLIFVPAASVAKDGMRLGWGRGYFDRALGALQNEAPTYAVLYDHEVVEDVPREVHDQPVKGVVTPERIMTFA